MAMTYVMNRRDMMLAAIAAVDLFGGAGRALAVTPFTAGDYLRGIYAREIARHNSRQAPDNDAFDALFTRAMRELMHAPRRPDPNALDGPILHALFGYGALPGREVTLGTVTTVRQNAYAAVVNVALSVAGNPREVVVMLLREDDAWHIDDINYGERETLAARYRRMTGK